MKSKSVQLSPAHIASSSEIQSWLDQFSASQRPIAISLLLQLRFVSRDSYSTWLDSRLNSLLGLGSLALYAVRKFETDDSEVWDIWGRPTQRPAESLGSEDLVISAISDAVRTKENILDHPTLTQIKSHKIKHIVLIDDSIGSGERVSDYILRMMKSTTFRSWWSLGWLKLHILSYARTKEAERNIIGKIPGSNHHERKFPKSSKVLFYSHRRYDTDNIKLRWGAAGREILQLCDDLIQIPVSMRRGYEGVMSNYIFYHSVPDNVPGCLYYISDAWKPLFPARRIPSSIASLLEVTQASPTLDVCSKVDADSPALWELLRLLKSGVRIPDSLSFRLGWDTGSTLDYLQRARALGLIDAKNRLSKSGVDFIYRFGDNRKGIDTALALPRPLYIPTTWCTDHVHIQPPDPDLTNGSDSGNSVEGKLSIEGDIG